MAPVVPRVLRSWVCPTQALRVRSKEGQAVSMTTSLVRPRMGRRSAGEQVQRQAARPSQSTRGPRASPAWPEPKRPDPMMARPQGMLAQRLQPVADSTRGLAQPAHPTRARAPGQVVGRLESGRWAELPRSGPARLRSKAAQPVLPRMEMRQEKKQLARRERPKCLRWG